MGVGRPRGYRVVGCRVWWGWAGLGGTWYSGGGGVCVCVCVWGGGGL